MRCNHNFSLNRFRKTKILPLCSTRLIERLDALAVFIQLFGATLATFDQLSREVSNQGTRSQAFSLSKSLDFDFLVTHFITQKVQKVLLLSFTHTVNLVSACEDSSSAWRIFVGMLIPIFTNGLMNTWDILDGTILVLIDQAVLVGCNIGLTVALSQIQQWSITK